MFDLLIPDEMFSRYAELTPEYLKSRGVRTLLSDLDNTLAPYEMPAPDENLTAWIRSLSDAGIRLVLVSNNHPDRVDRFNENLHLTVFPDAGKPSRKAIRHAMDAVGADETSTAVLGDQLLTDCFAGKRMGLPAFIVPPIQDKTTPFFRFKRLLERPFIRRFAKQKGFRPYLSFWKIQAEQ